MAERTAKVAAGRRRAAAAKQGLAAGAVAAFVATLLLARAGHSAPTGETPAPASRPAAVTDDSSGFDLGGGAIAQAPQRFSGPSAQSGLS